MRQLACNPNRAKSISSRNCNSLKDVGVSTAIASRVSSLYSNRQPKPIHQCTGAYFNHSSPCCIQTKRCSCLPSSDCEPSVRMKLQLPILHTSLCKFYLHAVQEIINEHLARVSGYLNDCPSVSLMSHRFVDGALTSQCGIAVTSMACLMACKPLVGKAMQSIIQSVLSHTWAPGHLLTCLYL